MRIRVKSVCIMLNWIRSFKKLFLSAYCVSAYARSREHSQVQGHAGPLKAYSLVGETNFK